MSFRPHIHAIKGATEQEKRNVEIACDAIANIINGKEYWERAAELWPKCTHRYITRRDRTRKYLDFQEYREMTLSGIDQFNSDIDNDFDVHLTIYYKNNGTIGYTYPSTFKTWANRKFHKRFDIAERAGNIWHEYKHNQGFGHPNTDRKSVAYQMGYLMVDIIRESYGYPTVPQIASSRIRRPWYKRAWRKVRGWF